MDLTALVDVAIGLTLVYLGASLFVTIINEYIAQTLKLRGKQLAKDLTRLIDNDTIKDWLKKSPALAPFFSSKPASYVDPKMLAQLLVGALRPGTTGVPTMGDIITAINALPAPSSLKNQLLSLAQSTSGSVDAFVTSVSTWADRSLTMMGEVYKRRVQMISLGIGLGIAIIFNIDTLALTAHLYKDKEARGAAVAVAEELTAKTSNETFQACLAKKEEERRKDTKCAAMSGLVDSVLQRNATLGKLPLGWAKVGTPFEFLTAIGAALISLQVLGWLLTALALALGAPFWFDFLNRLVNIRHGMRKPEEAK